MAVRVTTSEVKAVASDDIPTSVSDLSVFIAVANRMVNSIITASTMDETDKTDVELYLAAHFAVLKYKFATAEKADVVSQSVQHKEDKGLDLTHYGQTAMQLDYSGALAKHNETIKKGGTNTPTVSWLGTELT